MRTQQWFVCAVLAAAVVLALCGLAAAANPNWPNGPNDNPQLEPPDDPNFPNQWNLFSYIPEQCLPTIRQAEIALGSGVSADRAWQVTTGSPKVVIAILDSGVYFEDPDLVNKYYLNKGELPQPMNGDQLCPNWDCNGSGVFNVQQYANDPRVFDANGNGILDPGDLILIFSDGIDNDHNGYIDDICGWDFFRNTNYPEDETRFGHGTQESEIAAAQTNNGIGGAGVCPNCLLLPVRVGDTFVADANRFAQGVVFATDSGASVISEALGTVNNTPFARAAVEYALSHNVAISASAADENAFHHNYPANYSRTITVNNLLYDLPMPNTTSFMALDARTNWGSKITVDGSSGCCSSCATAVVGGGLGLIYSRAIETGLNPPLTADEVFSIVAASATDVYLPEAAYEWWKYRTLPGWDKYTGHGRFNARAAVDMVTPTTIPPEAYIDSPGWFELVNPASGSAAIVGYVNARRASSFSYKLEAQGGVDPDPSSWTLFGHAENLTAPVHGVLGKIASARLRGTKAVSDDVTGEHAALVRLTVTDSRGNTTEYYHQFFFYSDPDWAPGFPIDLGASGEAPLTMADLAGDGVFALIVAAGDGAIHAFRAGGQEMPGWPQYVDLVAGQDPAGPNYLNSAAYRSGQMPSAWRQGVVGAPAVGDLDGTGEMSVVVGTLGGELYAWRADGELRAGFPVAMDPAHLDPTMRLDTGFFGAPLLTDLEGDGKFDIVAAGMDQYVYAWRGDGSAVAGWPVLCRDPSGNDGARIAATPAAANLFGDGRYEILVGTNEVYGNTGRVYALWPDGNGHAGGPFLPGWPIDVYGYNLNTLPILATGVSTSVTTADFAGDGKDRIVTHAGVAPPVIYDADGSIVHVMCPWIRSPHSGSVEPIMIPLDANVAIADLEGDGRLAIIEAGPGIREGIQLAITGLRIPADMLIGAWTADDGAGLTYFPRILEDNVFLGSSAVADITGDGRPSVIAGSGGYFLHAYNALGVEPAGWPKFTGGWLMGTAVVGDMDGDGLLEVAAATREGGLFVWKTKGRADGDIQWPSYQHDAQHSGNYGWPLPHQAGPDDDDNDDNDNDDDNDDDDNDNDDASPPAPPAAHASGKGGCGC